MLSTEEPFLPSESSGIGNVFDETRDTAVLDSIELRDPGVAFGHFMVGMGRLLVDGGSQEGVGRDAPATVWGKMPQPLFTMVPATFLDAARDHPIGGRALPGSMWQGVPAWVDTFRFTKASCIR